MISHTSGCGWYRQISVLAAGDTSAEPKDVEGEEEDAVHTHG